MSNRCEDEGWTGQWPASLVQVLFVPGWCDTYCGFFFPGPLFIIRTTKARLLASHGPPKLPTQPRYQLAPLSVLSNRQKVRQRRGRREETDKLIEAELPPSSNHSSIGAVKLRKVRPADFRLNRERPASLATHHSSDVERENFLKTVFLSRVPRCARPQRGRQGLEIIEKLHSSMTYPNEAGLHFREVVVDQHSCGSRHPKDVTQSIRYRSGLFLRPARWS